MPRKGLRLEKNEDNQVDEGYFWDRHKSGGGGAPLTDLKGTPVGNLRNVFRGNVELSPSSSNKKNSNHYDYDNNYDRDDDYDDNNNNNKNRSDHRSRDEYKSRDDNRGNNRNRNEEIRVSPVRSGNSLGAGIGNMHKGANDPEREAKIRRNMEYQQQLQQQIEEKKRIKNQEHRSAEKQKVAELDDYMTNQYKGPAPQYNQRKTNKKYDYDDDADDDLDSRDGYRSSNNRKNNNKYDNYDDEDNYDDNYKKKGGAVRFSESTMLKKDSRRNRTPSPDSRDGGNYSDDYNYNNRSNNDYNKDDNKSKNIKNKKYNSQNNENPGKNWVSKVEYDELSKLCDKLMNEQEALQTELRKQNHEIKELRCGRGSKVGPLGGAKKVQKVDSKTPRVSLPNINSKNVQPRKNSAPSDDMRRKVPQAPPVAPASRRPKSNIEKTNASKLNNVPVKQPINNRNVNNPPPKVAFEAPRSPPIPTHAPKLTGFAALAAKNPSMGVIKGGPKIMTYDDDLGGVNSPPKPINIRFGGRG